MIYGSLHEMYGVDIRKEMSQITNQSYPKVYTYFLLDKSQINTSVIEIIFNLVYPVMKLFSFFQINVKIFCAVKIFS